jgi:hypothetical protein
MSPVPGTTKGLASPRPQPGLCGHARRRQRAAWQPLYLPLRSRRVIQTIAPRRDRLSRPGLGLSVWWFVLGMLVGWWLRGG